MERKPPTPICKSFTVCRQIILDQFTQEYILVGPTQQIVSHVYPMVANLSVYARCTSVQGSYHLELQLQDLESTVCWRQIMEPPWDLRDPLAIGQLNIQNLGVFFQKPGRYEFVLLMNGEEVFRDVFLALLPPPPPT